jgi:hypothetical protein
MKLMNLCVKDLNILHELNKFQQKFTEEDFD